MSKNTETTRPPIHHIVAMGKGGAGKTTTATYIASYYQAVGIDYLAFDTDQINASFFSFKTLNAERLYLSDDKQKGLVLAEKKIDVWLERLAISPCDTITDLGAGSFGPVIEYMLDMNMVEWFQSDNIGNHRFTFHVPLCGGEAMRHSINGLEALFKHFPKGCDFVVWLHKFGGPIEIDGKDFGKFAVYKDNIEKFTTVVDMPEQSEAVTMAMHKMLSMNKTLNDSVVDSSMQLAEKMRYDVIRNSLFGLLSEAACFYEIKVPVFNAYIEGKETPKKK